MPPQNRSGMKRVTVTYRCVSASGICQPPTILETMDGQAGYAAFPNEDNPVAIKAFAGHDTVIVPFANFASVLIELNVSPASAPTDATLVG